MDHFKQKIFPQLREAYPCIEIEKTIDHEEIVFLRSSISSCEEVEKFMTLYSKITSTNWIILHQLKSPMRVIASKKWECQHSKHNKSKTKSTSRNTDCRSYIEIRVKLSTKKTKKTDRFLTRTPPLPAVIKIALLHNHDTNVPNTMKMLRPTNEIKKTFYGYFDDGLASAEAVRLHVAKMLVDEQPHEKISSSHFNPTHNQVRHLHKEWKQERFGIISPLLKLQEKIKLYEETGITIKIKTEDSWALLIVTPIMSRAQNRVSSGEVIFIDSTATVDSSRPTLTVMFTPTNAGVVPIAVFVHELQTSENYSTAFSLLKQHFPNCFGGKEFPDTFMTGNATAEKEALKQIWPLSMQFLCHSHVAQAEWKWLFSSTNCIPKNERPRLMEIFQKVMLSDTMQSLKTAKENILLEKTKYPTFVKHFESFFERKKEWIQLYRMSFVTKDYNTIIFSEATMRIIKDIILYRTRYFTVVALVDFIVSVLDKSIKSNLLECVNNQGNSPHIFYDKLREEVNDSAIVNDLGEHFYEIQSNTDSNQTYIVQSKIGLCTCTASNAGAMCKHQFLLVTRDQLHLPNTPICDEEEKHNLTILALGNKCLP